ncbi:MAG TPA: hypothetical protein VNA24_34375 [Hyalangium sp.]|nr:hypothetical protein [Hyalangium sp.]
MLSKNALSIVTQVNTTGIVLTQGMHALTAMREAIQHFMKESGLTVTFDPDSDPELIDYLGLGAVNGLQGAVVGSMIGGILGALTGNKKVAAAGAAVGAVGGILHGLHQAEAGWRVRAVRDTHHVPVITLRRLAA